MECTREVTDDIYWVGGNDRRLGLFENIHPVPDGVSYNAYLISDDKTCLMDTCDWAVGQRFMENLEAALNGRKLDVLVVDHMEPDHAATVNEVLIRWPDVEIYCTMMASRMYGQYGYKGLENLHTVSEGETLSLAYEEIPQAKKVLRAAAMTYVVAALSSLVSLLRLFLMAKRSSRR